MTCSVNELMTGVTGAASNEFVEIANTGTAAADLSAGSSSTGLRPERVTSCSRPSPTARLSRRVVTSSSAAPPVPRPAARPELLGEHRRDGRRRGPPRPRQSRRLGRLGNGDERVRGRHGGRRTSDDRGAGTSTGRVPDGDDTNDNAADFVLDDSPTPKAANG